MKSIKCWGRRKLGFCYEPNINWIDEDIRVIELCLGNIEKMKSIMKSCIVKNSIEKVLEFKGDYISEYYWYEVRDEERNKHCFAIESAKIGEREKKPCNLNPKDCNESYKSKKNNLDNLIVKLETDMQKYNNELAIIKKVQNYCANYSTSDKHIDKSIYIRFGRDKYNSLIALYFNIEGFVKSKSYSPFGTIFVFSGEGEYPFDRQTMLHLKYDKFDSVLSGTEVIELRSKIKIVGAMGHICDFISNNGKRGHGTFILQHLEDIISKVNKAILNLDKNPNDNFNHMIPIKFITGEVVPGAEISNENLVKFYNKNGFPTIGKTYVKGGYVPNKIIFKELS